MLTQLASWFETSELGRTIAAGAFWFVLAVVVALPFLTWGTDKAPQFYGAFTAAIVAAVAVIAGAYYQAKLTRDRDEAIRQQELLADAVELCYWLEHAADEMRFIADFLKKWVGQKRGGDDSFQPSLEQLREVVTAPFMAELSARAKAATRLPAEVSDFVSATLYKTFATTDRIYFFRGIDKDFPLTADYLEKYLDVTRRCEEKLRAAHTLLLNHLAEEGAINRDMVEQFE